MEKEHMERKEEDHQRKLEKKIINKIKDFITTMQGYNNDLKDSEEVECLS